MDKSITIIYEEFKENFANLINNCGLPICMVEPILENYLNEVKNIVKKQYEFDKRQYEESIKNSDIKDNSYEKENGNK